MIKTPIYILISIHILLFVSCKQSARDERCELLRSGKYLHYAIDDETKIPQAGVFLFEDSNRKKILTFQNEENEIVFYDLLSGDFLKKVTFETEGSNAVAGRFAGYYIHDFDNIFILSLYPQFLYHTDTTAVIKKKSSFQQTDDGQSLTHTVLSPGRAVTAIGDKFYVPQGMNPLLGERMVEDSRIGAVIDTAANSIKLLPMKLPPLITYKDIGTSAGFGAHYSYCYDGTSFVYSFFQSHTMLRASQDFDKIEEVEVKGRYVGHVEVLRINSSDMKTVLKAELESASYGSLVYDKYRDVYYRFAFPKTALSANDDPFAINSSWKRQFSILILDRDLRVIGETLFPKDTYNSKLYFVLEDGLYLSTNHVKNPQYSDDILTFERVELVFNGIK